MINITKIHDWELDYGKARRLQVELAEKIELKPIESEPKLIAGLDCAFIDGGRRIIAAVVVLKRPNWDILETTDAVCDVKMPYIPGLLSFREGPACIAALEKLDCDPDLIMVDGQGIAHPRRLGLASHIGLFVDKPVIGCAKSRLIGKYDEPGNEKRDHTLLYDKGEIIGAVVRTRNAVKPLFISPGNNCTFADAVKYSLETAIKYRLPEPTGQAHKLVSRLKMQI